MTPSYNIILEGKTAAYATLGCKLNYAETSSLRDRLMACGVRDVTGDGAADLCIVNTCSVTGEAEAKCRHTINRLHRRHPDALIVVMGCYAQLAGQHLLTLDGVGLVVGMEHKGEVIDLICQHLETGTEAAETSITTRTADIRTFVPSCSRGERTRYFLKVQDGCNYYCTYCTIPMARGRSRNGSIESLVAQAREAAAAGGREIVITGVNIGDFGRSTGESFIDLLRALDAVEGIERYRISSIEPNLLTDEVIDFCAQSRAFMPHFHLPLQCGSDTVLRLMHRHYDTALFTARVARIHEVMPDAFIGVDVIVGTRGETAALFDEAEAYIRDLDVSQLHVFSYSERPGTKALEIPHTVTPQEKHERSQRLIALSEEKRIAHYARHRGETRPVLWEHARPGRPLQGWTDNYIRVTLAPDALPCPDAVTRLADTMGTVILGDFTEDKESLLAHIR